MPTTTNTKAKIEPKAPKSIDLNSETSELDVGNAGRECLTFLEKKMRNLEKRKKKMEINREKASNGEKLEKEAQLSLEQYDSVAQDLQFARELHNQFVSINEQHEDSVKKMPKKEMKRIEEILRLQFTLDQLGGDNVRQDFMTGKHGAVVLTQNNLDQLDALYQVISPSRESQEKDDIYAKKLFTAASHLVNYLDAEDSQVVGTTYRQLNQLVSLINGCGYFERVHIVDSHDRTRDQDKSEESASDDQIVEESEPIIDQTLPEDPVETVAIAQSVEEAETQPLNTLEQDAFFAPSSSPYQSSSAVSDTRPFSSQSVNSSIAVSSKPSLPDIQSFTHNRPFQFIQTSYVMPDTNSPSVVDPAVIAAQPAGAHGLQFMSPLYDASVVSSPPVVPPSQQPPQQQPSSQQQQQQAPQQSQSQHQHPSHQSTGLSTQQPPSQPAPPTGLAMPVDLSQAPVDLSQPATAVKQQQQTATSLAQDYSVTSNFPQSDNLFGSQRDDRSPATLPGHGENRAASSLRDESINSMNSYEIPPSIPMPPSQGSQEPGQVEPQEKKSPMNANAPVFQSMYAQGVPHQVNMPPPSVTSAEIQTPHTQSDFSTNTFGGPSGDFVGAGDFQAGYQGSNGFANGNFARGPSGNRGNYRGPRGNSSGPTNGMNSRNGGAAYQNYTGPNHGYRADSFQTGSYGASSFGAGGNYSKRGGINNSMGGGPGNAGYPRPAGMGGNTGRGGAAMRGGIPRGGPRGSHRGYSRP